MAMVVLVGSFSIIKVAETKHSILVVYNYLAQAKFIVIIGVKPNLDYVVQILMSFIPLDVRKRIPFFVVAAGARLTV